eukprot:g24857.t1
MITFQFALLVYFHKLQTVQNGLCVRRYTVGDGRVSLLNHFTQHLTVVLSWLSAVCYPSGAGTGPLGIAPCPAVRPSDKLMLVKMGYREGEGLGKFGQGRKEIVEASLQRGRRGLGLKIKGFDGDLDVDWHEETEPLCYFVVSYLVVMISWRCVVLGDGTSLGVGKGL